MSRSLNRFSFGNYQKNSKSAVDKSYLDVPCPYVPLNTAAINVWLLYIFSLWSEHALWPSELFFFLIYLQGRRQQNTQAAAINTINRLFGVECRSSVIIAVKKGLRGFLCRSGLKDDEVGLRLEGL